MHNRMILVVEDDAIVRTEAALLFEEAGLTVVELDNADDALAFIYDQPAEIAGVFSDVKMPGRISGLHLAETVARHWPVIPVILASGLLHPEAVLPANVRFLSKPWLPNDVLIAMQVAGAG